MLVLTDDEGIVAIQFEDAREIHLMRKNLQEIAHKVHCGCLKLPATLVIPDEKRSKMDVNQFIHDRIKQLGGSVAVSGQ